ncbi:MAG: serine hydrolase domain-containing protein [Bacteroidia bacterium]|nr:serine hydrolase domain-containing protein [Bacteroidia bacterium]
MKKYFIICLSLISFYACETDDVVAPATYNCQLSGPDNTDAHPDKAAIDRALEEIGAISVGVQVSVKDKNGLWYNNAMGKADIPNDVVLEACTKTMVGSISKTFTGVLIMQLQDDGILSVDDMLKDWLDESVIGEIENADQVNLGHLLTHTSGIRDYLGVKQYINALNTSYLLETQEEKLRYIYGKKAELAVGEKYSYSNSNYVLLGLVIEKARNMPLWDAVDTYIVKRLGLENTEMGTHENPIPEGTARPYRNISGRRFEDVMHIAVSDAATGDGGIASNMQDLNLFFDGLFTGQLMSNEAFQQMTDSELLIVGEGEEDYPQWPDESYGLGISLWNTPKGVAYGHTGSTSTYEAYSFYFPDTGVAISIGYNAAEGNGLGEKQRAFREKLFDILLD